jgi:Flp pilus assembly protein TadD
MRLAARGLPDRPRVHYNLGLLLQQLGEQEKAERELRHAVELSPEDFDLVFALAYFYAESGRPAEAGALARRMVELRPADPRGHRLLEQARAQRR